MSLYQLRLNPTDNRSIKTLQKCSDIDFVIVPAFMEIEALRRAIAKYAIAEILNDGYTLPNVLLCYDKQLSYMTDAWIRQAERKANNRFPLHETFYLITKPEGIDLYSFAAWVNSLKL